VLDAAAEAVLLTSYKTSATSGIELPRRAIHDGNATGPVELLLKDAVPGERFSQAIPGLLIATTTLAVAWLLFLLLRCTQSGEPFTRGNMRFINTTALIVGARGMLVIALAGEMFRRGVVPRHDVEGLV
jgi:hypothetical protein